MNIKVDWNINLFIRHYYFIWMMSVQYNVDGQIYAIIFSAVELIPQSGNEINAKLESIGGKILYE